MARDRLIAVDRLRGAIMVLMALDHASSFLSDAERVGEFWGGAFPVYDSPLPFVVRVVTHLCAPGFFGLMGASMVLMRDGRVAKGETEGSVARFLVTRGAVLVLLQHLVVNPAWLLGGASGGHAPGDGNGPIWLYFGVLYGLGAAMILLTPLLRAPTWAMATVGVVGLGFTAVATPSPELADTLYHPVVRLLWVPGETAPLMVRYPVLPWVSFTAFGMVLGRGLRANAERTFRVGAVVGLGLIAGFFALRGTGLGSFHQRADGGWIEWLNVTKYPPSLAFFAGTVGVNLVLLFALSRWRPARDPLAVFGKGALFFYVVHLYLYGVMGRLVGEWTILGMLPWWLLGLALLYPVTDRWVRFKWTRPPGAIWRYL